MDVERFNSRSPFDFTYSGRSSPLGGWARGDDLTVEPCRLTMVRSAKAVHVPSHFLSESH